MAIISRRRRVAIRTALDHQAKILTAGSSEAFRKRVQRILSQIRRCTFKRPCRLAGCPFCADFIRKVARGRLRKQIMAAMYSKSRHLHFLTFTCPRWTLDYDRVCPELNAFAQTIIDLKADLTDITGTWLAVEVSKSRRELLSRDPEVKTENRPRWQWHIHGVTLSKTVRRPIEALSELCREHGVSMHIQRKDGPADSDQLGDWTSRQELYGLIRYCDKSQTGSLQDTVDEIARKVAINSSVNQYSTGELAPLAANELVLRTASDFKSGLLGFRQSLDLPPDLEFERALASLDHLCQLVRDKRNQQLDFATSIEYLSETIEFCQDLLRPAIAKLLVEGARRFERIADNRFTGLGLQLFTGCEILSMRLERRRSHWSRIEKLHQFWTAKVYGENAGRLRSQTWFWAFVDEVFEQQLGLLLPSFQ